MWFTRQEIKDINDGLKRLTIRQYKSNGNLPIKVGSETWLKTGSLVSKERYGRIRMIGLTIKELGMMTDTDAKLGGYGSAEEYIEAQLTEFNSDCSLETEMLFYTFEVISLDSDLINSL